MWISKVALTDIINEWLQKPGRSVFFDGQVHPGDRVQASYVEGMDGGVGVVVVARPSESFTTGEQWVASHPLHHSENV